MSAFLTTALTFPTVLWSAALVACLLTWGLVALGTLDEGSLGGGEAGAGLLARLGLGGVPGLLVFTVLAVTGWLGTYLAHLLVLSELLPGVTARAFSCWRRRWCWPLG
ncbi:hypothetical protein K7W42_07405 [Deinococcus sp. HMF7604]|uniref:hypothetical protein n=1 Tax=Deinococcus betulae TaxID=2873312 RepID=UPI001CC9641A|nr:hypothetical protein [Deinococcus betulae]MBZ9750687.1 hypothetical protein [Deinococcus betulae]